MILTAIGGGFQLEQGAALSLERAFAAGCPRTYITETYRPYSEQERIFRERYTTDTSQALWRSSMGTTDRRPWLGRYWYRRAGMAMAAIPGTSIHGNGNAIDCDDPMRSWLHAHPDYGFVFPIPSEKWHGEYRIANDKHANEGDTMQPVEVWAYKNGTGAPDAFQIVNNAAAYAAQANAKADKILAALAKIPAMNATAPVIDYARIIEGVANELDKRAAARLSQVKDA